MLHFYINNHNHTIKVSSSKLGRAHIFNLNEVSPEARPQLAYRFEQRVLRAAATIPPSRADVSMFGVLVKMAWMQATAETRA